MRTERFNKLTIRTPEGVSFSYTLAGPMQRMWAFSIDTLICFGLIAALTLLCGLLSVLFGMAFDFKDMAMAAIIAGSFVLTTCYGFVMEWFFDGQTLGKKMMKIKVMDARGRQLEFHQVAMRNLLRVVDSNALTYPIAGILIFLTKCHQRLGDLAGGTVVVQLSDTTIPPLDSILPDTFNSFRKVPHLAARLRQLVGPQEAALAVRALIRRDKLDDLDRAELFKEMADYYRAIVQFPEEIVFGLSNEKYVQNVVDVVFRDGRQPGT